MNNCDGPVTSTEPVFLRKHGFETKLKKMNAVLHNLNVILCLLVRLDKANAKPTPSPSLYDQIGMCDFHYRTLLVYTYTLSIILCLIYSSGTVL